jgi:hypothetical protein
MFQVVPPPIIRSSKLYTQHRVFVELLLLVTAIVSELGLQCNIIQHSLLLSMLYMFQAILPPIIRSSKLYTQHRVFVELLLLLTAIVSELGLLDKYPMLCVQF